MGALRVALVGILEKNDDGVRYSTVHYISYIYNFSKKSSGFGNIANWVQSM